MVDVQQGFDLSVRPNVACTPTLILVKPTAKDAPDDFQCIDFLSYADLIGHKPTISDLLAEYLRKWVEPAGHAQISGTSNAEED